MTPPVTGSAVAPTPAFSEEIDAINASVFGDTPEPKLDTETQPPEGGAPPEATPAPKDPPEGQATPSETTTTPAAEPDNPTLKEIEDKLQDPELSRRDRRHWERMKARENEHATAIREREEKLTAMQRERDEFKTKAEAAADYEKVKTERQQLEEEARKYRAYVEQENDPVFRQKYDDRGKTLTTSIEKELLAIGMKEKAHTVKVKTKDEDGNDVEREVPGVSLEDIRSAGGLVGYARANPSVYGQLIAKVRERNPVAASVIDRNVADLVNLESEKAQELSKVKENYKEFYSSREKQAEQNKQQQAAQQQRMTEALKGRREQIYSKFPAFKIATADAKATAEEKAKIEAANKAANTYRTKLEKYEDALFFGKGTPDDLAEGALRAVLYETEKSDHDATKAKLKAAEDKLAAIGKAGRSTTSASLTPSAPANTARNGTVKASNANSLRDVTDKIFDNDARIQAERAREAAGTLP